MSLVVLDTNVVSYLMRIREQRRNQTISVDDAWIAATALAWSAELATHNPVDFAGIPALRVITVPILPAP